uniref:Uncharacterized protein n=1 Tax=Strongyloides stercoralis TaxID=6248 RepID=A0AAF5DKD8_STRER
MILFSEFSLLFISKSFFEGYLDKMCKLLSDAVLDNHLARILISNLRVIEVVTKNGIVLSAIRMTTSRIVHDIYVDHFDGIVNAGNYELASGFLIDDTEKAIPFQFWLLSSIWCLLKQINVVVALSKSLILLGFLNHCFLLTIPSIEAKFLAIVIYQTISANEHFGRALFPWEGVRELSICGKFLEKLNTVKSFKNVEYLSFFYYHNTIDFLSKFMERNSSEKENIPPSEETSPGGDGKYYKRKFHSDPSRCRPNMRSERIKEENRDRKEDNSGRKRRSDRIDSGNLVGKKITRDDNYYGERSFRSKPSCHNSDECLGKNEKKKWDYNENKNSRRRRESSSTVYSESPVRERLFPRIDSYYQEILFCSKSSRHSSDKDYNENKTSRRRRGFGAIDYESPVRKGSSTRDDNYYGKRSFYSKSSHRKSDKCLGKNEKKNRDYDENKTSRGNGFGTIDFENPVKKGSSTKKNNYYGKKLPRSDSSFHKSDKCLKRDEEKNENHKEDTRDDCGQSYKDITGEERPFGNNDFDSSVKEKGISEHDELHRNNKDTKNDGNCQYKDESPVERRSFTQDENYDKERPPHSHQLPSNSDKHKNYEEKDTRNDCCQQSGDEFGKEKHSDDNNSNSPVGKIISLQSIETSIEKASEESRDEDHSISILPKPATSSPQKEKTIVLSPKGIEYSTSNGSKNKKTTIQ